MRKMLILLLIAIPVIWLSQIKYTKGIQHPNYEDEGCSEESAEYYKQLFKRLK